ncbi:VOC family protein [Nocardia arizonensis]|uniref:VOC family protein n=1 Tax=Nocardia arizonensis TaxID=1141647 RepID=UPI0006D2171A|nr:VOC family protein [Nocardia arizonensis]
MPQKSSYEPGVPCWVDLGTTDMEAAKGFYGDLFGWQAQTSPDPQYGGYTMFTDAEGHEVAAAMPTMDPGQPPAWTTYVTVSDADAAAKNVQVAGGQLLVEPMDIPGQGRMAIFADPMGAVAGIWQPRGFPGAGLVNEPNTYCWSELACRDIDAAETFYREVFGWDGTTSEFGDSTYTEWKVDGRSIAGMVEMNDQWPAEVPPHWMVYFAVDDCDASARRTAQLGGSVSVPPTDIPIGRFAVLADPQGAHFSIIRLNA